MSGVPVRLVRKNGELIELLATDITLDVQRKTGGIALPLTGSTRVGFDLNMNNAVIILNGVITDDDIVHTTGNTKGATSFIDFSGTYGSVTTLETSAWTTEIDRIIQNQDPSASDTANVGNADHSIKLIASDGTTFDIYLAISSSTYGIDTAHTPNRYYISVNDSSGANRSAVNIATYLNALINASLSAHFTSTLVTSSVTSATTTKVIISSVVKSNAANTASPAMTADSWPSEAKRPYHGKFKGGYSELTKSAGDKVMDLFGTLNNSNNGGLGMLASGAGAMGMAHGALLSLTNDTDESVTNFTDAKYGDYIIGIQIPYNSMVKATGSNKYDPVNFFMPTGPFHSADSKGSSKALPAGTKFDWIGKDAEYSGIQGTVQKATFVQLGGEPIYQFNIIFAPIDIII